MREIFQIIFDAIFDVLSEAYWRIKVGGLLGVAGGLGVAAWLGWGAGATWIVAAGLGLGLLFGVIWQSRGG